MNNSPKFWISMAVFLVVFGVAVFMVTRDLYKSDSDNITTNSSAVSQPAVAVQGSLSSSPTFSLSTMTDPDELARQGDEFFASTQYDQAAQTYERLLELVPSNVDTYNNLGITLHYLGRSAEAVDRLNAGVAVDPAYQRIWLTLGYVNSQIGNIEQARTALTTALEMGADNDIGQSAAQMLSNLP